jgi:sugar lactone lactonase YvrE
MRRIVLLLMLVVGLAAPAAVAQGSFPETIPLPTGWQPEGITVGEGTTFYVGSIPTGGIFRGDLSTGTGAVFIPGAPGRAATGLEYDSGKLFVSGAGTGKAFIYDAATGALIREYQLATGTAHDPTFINDVVVTPQAAYFTDSMRAVLYRVRLGLNGTPAPTAEVLPLTGDFQQVPGFNLNGIDATADGKTLIVVQSATGKLFTVNPTSGVTKEIGLGGATLPNGDGIFLAGSTLYVVQNQLNQIAVVRLATDLASGEVVRTITDPDFDVPTTIDRFQHSLYAVNSRFGIPSPAHASYDVVKVAI